METIRGIAQDWRETAFQDTADLRIYCDNGMVAISNLSWLNCTEADRPTLGSSHEQRQNTLYRPHHQKRCMEGPRELHDNLLKASRLLSDSRGGH